VACAPSGFETRCCPRRTTHSGLAIFSGVQLRWAQGWKACVPTTLRHRHALAIEVNLANPFDPGQHVIGGLTAHTHQFGADNSGHEIARQIQNFLRGCAFKSLAKNRRHCPGKGLHFGPERHPNLGLAICIDMQINADGVRAFLVFADILQIELLALARLLFPRVVGIGDERLPPLLFREVVR